MFNFPQSKKQNLFIIFISLAFIAWSAIFIWQSSGIGIDGKRYFCLFDDAMIAMRYAWNFSHGKGLVWNVGERVEGFTTMLLTLLMSFITWLTDHKSYSCLIIQIFGIFLMLSYAMLNAKLSRFIFQSKISINPAEEQFTFWFPVLVFLLSLSYYPLLYFSLMGMETGLLAVIIAAATYKVLQEKLRPDLPLAILFGLAYYTRPDAAIPVAILFIYRHFYLLKKYTFKIALKTALTEGTIIFIFVAAIHIFRFYYYDSWVPNTYVLKIEGMSLWFRLQNGFGFIKQFLWETILIWPFIITALVIIRRKEITLFILLFISSVIYQVWAGGDPWIFWRMMAPYVPLMFIVIFYSLFIYLRKLSEILNLRIWNTLLIFKPFNFSKIALAFFITTLIILSVNHRFLSVIFFKYAPYQTDANKTNINTALALNEITTENASVAVLWGGTIPYYTDLKAIDMLGKSDTFIASLPPDLNMPIHGMKSLVGHNKYDLNYSIIKLKPTYVQNFFWANQDISDYGIKNYEKVLWKGVKLDLLKNSPDVKWKMIRFKR